MESEAYHIVTTQSNIDWVGRKVTGSHSGTVSLKKGTLYFLDDRFIGGEVIIDINSLKILDITDPATNYQFASHLHSADFFYTDEYPEAYLEITHVLPEQEDEFLINGDLTIRGITKPQAFQAKIKPDNGKASVIAKITIDRTDYGMKFGSGNFFKNLGDYMIYNDFELFVHLTAITSIKHSG